MAESEDFMRVKDNVLNTFGDTVDLSGLSEFVAEQLDKWRKIPLNVAITGASGMGKSSLINAFLNLTAEDTGCAAVGCTETTMEVTSFSHPANENLKFWDLPGVGTPRFPKDTYCEKVELKKYDFFLILTNTRFTENDHWLANEIDRKMKNSFFFIRTKIDLDMKNNKKSHPRSHNETKALDDIRNYLIGNLSDFKDKIFLISSYNTAKWDFPKMTEKLLDSLPSIKREALTMSLNFVTDTVVKRKTNLLRDRIWKVAEESSRKKSYPISHANVRAYIPLLVKELKFYKRQFGLEENSLETQALRLGISLDEMKQDLTAANTEFTHEYVCGILKGTFIHTAEELVRKYPSLRDQGGVSFVASHELLKEQLNKLKADALSVLDKSLRHKVGDLLIKTPKLSTVSIDM